VPVYDFEIVTTQALAVSNAEIIRGQLPDDLREPLARLLRPLDLEYGWPSDGVLMPRDWDKLQKPTLVREYNPSLVADEILTHVTRLDPDKPEAILDFVNQWGLLGSPGVNPDVYQIFHEGLPAEAISWTSGVLQDLKFLARALFELQRGRVIPLISACVLINPEDEGRPVEWAHLADAINMIGHTSYRTVRVYRLGKRPVGLRVVERPGRLLDVLGLALLDRATGMARQRRCPECGSYFVPTRSNQRFCKRKGEPYCARKHTLRAWRHRTRRKVRRR
jgi:hypothetical protein